MFFLFENCWFYVYVLFFGFIGDCCGGNGGRLLIGWLLGSKVWLRYFFVGKLVFGSDLVLGRKNGSFGLRMLSKWLSLI